MIKKRRIMEYKLEKGLACCCLLHAPSSFIFCAAAATTTIVEASRSRSAHVAGTRRHKRALDASSANIDTKVKMIEVCNRHRTCDIQIWSQALTQLSYLILFKVGENAFSWWSTSPRHMIGIPPSTSNVCNRDEDNHANVWHFQSLVPEGLPRSTFHYS